MTNNDNKSQQAIGYGILAELRGVVARLSQSQHLQVIMPVVQEYIAAYGAYLAGLSLHGKPLYRQGSHVSDESTDIMPPIYNNEEMRTLWQSRLLLEIPQGINCSDIPQACDIQNAWTRLVVSQFEDFVDAINWVAVNDLLARKREIEAALEALRDNNGIEPLREAIQNSFGYEISFETDSSEWEGELLNLLTANLHIAAYFQEMLGNNSDLAGLTGLDVVRRILAQNPDGTAINIILGALNREGEGYVGMPGSDDENLDNIQFGESIRVATIVHELGHQFDRWFRLLVRDNQERYSEWPTKYFNENLASRTLVIALNEDVYQFAIQGFAGKQLLGDEIFADIFMTAILSNSANQSQYQVFSIDEESLQGIVNYDNCVRSIIENTLSGSDTVTIANEKNRVIGAAHSNRITCDAQYCVSDSRYDFSGCTCVDISCSYRPVGWQGTRTSRAIQDFLWDSEYGPFHTFLSLVN